jgi:hypothetical protein
MTDERNSQPDRLEAMLEQWGADTAAAEQQVGPAPRELSFWRLPWMWRYAVPAAAMVLIALLAIWGPIRGMQQPTQSAGSSTAERQDREDREDRLQQELRELHGRHSEEVVALQAKLSKARERRHELESLVAEANRQVDELESANRDYREQLAGLVAQEQDLAKLQERLEVLQGQLTRLQLQLAEQAGKGEAMEQRVAALRLQRQQVLAHMRELYFAGAAGGRRGLAAAITAARENRLLERIGMMRQGGVASDAGAALQKSEALLLRLAMLPGGDAAQAREWVDAVRRSGVVSEIDEALLRDPPDELARLLLEARAIFTEVTHVG